MTITTDELDRLRDLLAELDAVTDDKYLMRLANGGRISAACATFLRDNGHALLQTVEAVMNAPVGKITYDGRSWEAGGCTDYRTAVRVLDRECPLAIGQRVRLVPVASGEGG